MNNDKNTPFQLLGRIVFACLLACFSLSSSLLAATQYEDRDLSHIISGPDGNLWFTEGYANKIGRLNPRTGAYKEFDIRGDARPEGIAVGSDGNIWFTELMRGRIGILNIKTGKVTEIALHSAEGAEGIISTNHRNIWIATNSEYLAYVTVHTHALKEYRLPTDCEPTELAADRRGNIWFVEANSEGNKIGRFNTKSKRVKEFKVQSWKEGNCLNDITLGTDGNLWFTIIFGDRVDCINSFTGRIREFHLRRGSLPFGIVSGPDGNIWFSESDSPGRQSMIGCLNPRTRSVKHFRGLKYGIAQHLTVGPDGNIWFTEQEDDSHKAGNAIGRINIKTGAITEFALPPFIKRR